MELYHACTLKQLRAYLRSGCILPPVRAWRDLDGATRFAKQTDRRIILRLTALKGFRPLGGHQDQAMVSDTPYTITEDFLT